MELVDSRCAEYVKDEGQLMMTVVSWLQPRLVLILPGEDWPTAQHLCKNTPDGPDVDGLMLA